MPPNLAICPPHPSNMDEKSLSTLYPILNDYLGLELSALAQKNSVAIPVQEPSAQVTNGVRKVNQIIILLGNSVYQITN